MKKSRRTPEKIAVFTKRIIPPSLLLSLMQLL
jgi:hypothetical protein